MEVILIRHGDPDYARDSLTPHGQLEARAVADRVHALQPEALYVSPMGRAQQTAAAIAQKTGLGMTTLPWLHELNGDFDRGRWCWSIPPAEVPGPAHLMTADNWHDHVPYGALVRPQTDQLRYHVDSLLAKYGYIREGARYRLEPHVRRLPAAFGRSDRPQTWSGVRVALVCHGGLILTLLGSVLNWPVPSVYSHLSCDTASMTRLAWLECGGYAAPKALVINDTSYLDGLSRDGTDDAASA